MFHHGHKHTADDTIQKKMKRIMKSKRGLVFCAVIATMYMAMVNTNFSRRARILQEHEEMMYISGEETRDLITTDLGSGDCEIGNPRTEDGNPSPDNATRTLITSYPGSGKRFTWIVMKALTNGEVADDWNFSEKLDTKPLAIKTSWPHKEGRWAWGNQMDQVILLLRNPRGAIPSYHNLRFELDYASDWQSSYLRIPDTYTLRPTVERWEQWRDDHLKVEMDRWFNFIDFWMTGGFVEWKNETHHRCSYNTIDCFPKAVVDFDHFYQENPTNDFSKITNILDSSANVEVIAAQTRTCVLDKVFNKADLHQGQRPNPELIPLYRFTLPQFDRILNRTTEVIEKFGSGEPLAFEAVQAAPPFYDVIIPELLRILEKYNLDNYAEYETEVVIFLEEWTGEKYATTDCTTLTDDTDRTICTFMKDKDNHDIFSDGYYPDDFPYEHWLEDRLALAQLYYDTSLNTVDPAWLKSSDHCNWSRVTCDSDRKVTSLVLNDMGLTGAYPEFLNNLSALSTLTTDGNFLTGPISNDVCSLSGIQITADEANCDSAPPGCCLVPSESPSTVPSTEPTASSCPLTDQVFNTPGTYTFQVPDCVNSVYGVVLGGGGGAAGTGNEFGGSGGGGGALSWGSFPVSGGEELTIVVGGGGSGALVNAYTSGGQSGGDTVIYRDGMSASLLVGGGGKGGQSASYRGGRNQIDRYGAGGVSSGTERDGGGNGGRGGYASYNNAGGAGGGAGGYSGNGGNGFNGNDNVNGSGGQGGAGGGGTNAHYYCQGGGGVGLYGEGASGGPGQGGSGGQIGSSQTGYSYGGAYGGGGGADDDDVYANSGNGGNGAVRLQFGHD